MDTEGPHFGCFTLQQASPPGAVFVSDVGPDGQPSRKRKVHTKSRSGCTSCKARKVKCDEEHPCRNCRKRNEKCSFIPSPKRNSSVARCRQAKEKPAPTSPALQCIELSPINMKNLHLLHHFDSFTSRTFIMDPQPWKEAVITLALKNTYLMHAVFLISAMHLQHLQPSERGHQVVALENLCQVLPIFRNAMATIIDSKDYTVDSAEALIACAMLLTQYSWSFDSQTWSNLSGLNRGLLNVTLAFMDKLQGGSLSPMLLYSPRLHIERCMKNTAVPFQPEAVFSHCITCTKISDIQPEDPYDFYEPFQRLSTILWALDRASEELEESGLMLAAARYLFTWPNWLPEGFLRLVKTEDGRAKVVLLYYSAAISRLESDRYWWMRQRAIHMFKENYCELGDRCTECTSRAKEMFCDENTD